MDASKRPLAIVTGASSGIGRELARLCAEDGDDLVIAADQGPLLPVAEELRRLGAAVETVEADLATARGMDALVAAVGMRPVDALLASAGHGLGHAFFDQKKGHGDVVAGFKNKVQAMLSNVTSSEMLAAQHRKLAEPGTAGD